MVAGPAKEPEMKSMLIAALLTASAAFGGAAHAEDVAKVAPGTSHVVFENQYIRVVRSHFAPGGAEAAHTHPAGWYYVTRGGSLTVTGADGKTSVWAASSGQSEWSDGEGRHTARNERKTPMEYLLVEVKAAPTDFPNR